MAPEAQRRTVQPGAEHKRFLHFWSAAVRSRNSKPYFQRQSSSPSHWVKKSRSIMAGSARPSSNPKALSTKHGFERGISAYS